MGTIDEKDEAAKRGHAMSARERAVAARESALHRREQASAAEELAVGDRQVSLQTREEVLQLREDLVRAREEAALARAEHDQALHDLKEANEKLILASIRSQELAEVAEDARRQLELSERELREVAGFRERLIGIGGHDLRNPLSAIWVAVDLLCSGTISSSESEKLLHRVRTSTRRMGTMIEQLLDFTRAHVGGGLPVELKPTDLGEVCRRIVDELELGHAAENRFVCEFEGDLHGTWDPERMAQLISNLGGNAIAHGLADAPVHVRARADGEFVVLEIANLGTPIPSELLPVLFDPFSRARPKEKSVGLGLGLYISREIVVAHGGTIAVTSNADATRSPSACRAIRAPRQLCTSRSRHDRCTQELRPDRVAPARHQPLESREACMRIVYEEALSGRSVIDSTGRSIGEVIALLIDPEAWRVEAVRVKLHRGPRRSLSGGASDSSSASLHWCSRSSCRS